MHGFVSCIQGSDTYEGFKISFFQGESEFSITFDTGNPVVDYLEVILFAAKQNVLLLFSSDVDHFVSDSNGKYIWEQQDLIFSG